MTERKTVTQTMNMYSSALSDIADICNYTAEKTRK